MKDRIVEHPHRYRLVAVPGEASVYDLEPVPGVVTEVGTALSKGNLLSDNTAGRLGLAETTASPDIAFRRSNLSSFQAFCANVNADSLNAAFGKGNDARLCGLGRQLAMYAWYKEEDGTFLKLSSCDNLQDVVADAGAYGECLNSQAIKAMILASPYANNLFTNALLKNMGLYKINYAIMNIVLSTPEMLNSVIGNPTALNQLMSNQTVYTTSGQIIVPSDYEDRTCIVVEMIGKGNDGNSGNWSSSNHRGGGGGSGGEYKLLALEVAPGESIQLTIDENTTIKEISALKGSGASGGLGNPDASIGTKLAQSGKLNKVGNGGDVGRNPNGTADYNAAGGGGGGLLLPGYPIAEKGWSNSMLPPTQAINCGGGGIGFGAGGGGGHGRNYIDGKYVYAPGGAGAPGAIAVYL